RVQHVGNAGSGDERRQHRGEQLQRKPRHHQQPDHQRHPLATRRLARQRRGLGEPGPWLGRRALADLAHRRRAVIQTYAAPEASVEPATSQTSTARTIGAHSPNPDTNNATVTSTICNAVLSFDTYSGRITIDWPRSDSTPMPPTMRTSRNTTRM